MMTHMMIKVVPSWYLCKLIHDFLFTFILSLHHLLSGEVVIFSRVSLLVYLLRSLVAVLLFIIIIVVLIFILVFLVVAQLRESQRSVPVYLVVLGGLALVYSTTSSGAIGA